MKNHNTLSSNVLKNRTSIRIRYADIDKMGIVYNGNYLRFFEIGRTELIRSTGLSYLQIENSGYILPLITAHIEFLKPAYYDDLIEIETQLEISKILATIQFDYLLLRGKDLLATGYTIHSFIKKDIFKPVRPPKFFLEFIERKLAINNCV